MEEESETPVRREVEEGEEQRHASEAGREGAFEGKQERRGVKEVDRGEHAGEVGREREEESTLRRGVREVDGGSETRAVMSDGE